MIKSRKIEKTYDVIVVGGGMSGVCAAIAAARHGANTAIIQSRPVFGGNGSSEIRMHVTGAGCHSGKSNLGETGIMMELLLENKSRNPYQSFSIWDTLLWEKVRFQPNLDSYLNTSVDELDSSQGKITRITCHQTSTETTYQFTAKIFVDATGNGTVGFLAGAEYRIGSEGKAEFGEKYAPDEPNDFTMGNTLMFLAENKGEPVNFVKPSWAYNFTEEDLAFRGHGNMAVEHGKDGVKEEYNADSGYWWIELGGTSADIIADTENITDELYKCVYGIWDHIKNHGDHGAENYALTWVGSVPGIRESRRLVGDYLLNEHDVYANRIFPDAVAYGGWPMDEHPPEGLFHRGKPVRYLNFHGCYSIPYRCYYSKNIDNLMMAGRDISTTKMALGTTRVMGTCAVGGQAVGTAAALAIRYNCSPRDVAAHMGELQQLLLKDDCYIPGYQNQDPKDLALLATVTATSHQPGSQPQNVVNGVARTVESISNCWESLGLVPGQDALTLTLPEAKDLHQLRLTFDPNLTAEIMPSLTARVRNRQVKYLPVELISQFRVEMYNQDQLVYSSETADNCQRLVVLDLPDGTFGDRVVIYPLETYGYANAKIFEVRLY